jgi:hypothetical protein
VGHHEYVLIENGTHMYQWGLAKMCLAQTSQWGTETNIPVWGIENECLDSNWHQNTIQGLTLRKNVGPSRPVCFLA